MFYVAQEFGATTRYIIYCQGAPTSEEVAPGGYYPAPLHTLYHKRRTYELSFIRLTHSPTAHKWAWLYRLAVRAGEGDIYGGTFYFEPAIRSLKFMKPAVELVPTEKMPTGHVVLCGL